MSNFLRFLILAESLKLKLLHYFYSVPCFFFDIIDMCVPTSIITKVKTEIFMIFNFFNFIIVHIERCVNWFL